MGKLLSFAYWGLKQTVQESSSVGREVSLETRVKRQVAAFMEANCLRVPPELQSEGGPVGNSSARIKRAVVARYADGDVRRSVRFLA